MKHVTIIGAGVGGLTTAALLARAGLQVTVLEAHVYAGGCAGTFYHQKYRFDAGATLAGGFYPGGPMDVIAKAVGIEAWDAHTSDPAMVTYLPDGDPITRYTDEQRWEERNRAFGAKSERFWRWQEATADALWDFALRNPNYPPQTPRDAVQLVGHAWDWLKADPRRFAPGMLADAFQPVSAHLRGQSDRLRLFIDGQLLIAAQATSQHTFSLYGASALDLPRRGIVHMNGGMGGIADTLVQAVRNNGGEVKFRQEVKRIMMENGHPVAVETKRGHSFPTDIVIANLPPWNIKKLLGDHAPRKIKNLAPYPKDGWGAFMVYAGIDSDALPKDFPLHHQVITGEPLAEGNSIFISISPAWDEKRAPTGKRAITISTHTRLKDWWTLFETDKATYDARKDQYVNKMLAAAHRAIPHLRDASDLVMPGTPVTFNRFTRREFGWVGGFPQTNLFRAWGPRILPDVWMVGDSIFPGQSTAAVALGGMRVAESLLADLNIPKPSGRQKNTRIPEKSL